jgi:hypothetical protein
MLLPLLTPRWVVGSAFHRFCLPNGPLRIEKYIRHGSSFLHCVIFTADAVRLVGLYFKPPLNAAVSTSTKRAPSRRWIVWARCCRCRPVGLNDTAWTLSLYAALDIQSGQRSGSQNYRYIRSDNRKAHPIQWPYKNASIILDSRPRLFKCLRAPTAKK